MLRRCSASGKTVLVALWLLLCAGRVQAQNYSSWYNVPVSQWGKNLRYPLTGGLNNPQFSSIDLNGDGINDLFIYDRGSGRVFTFLTNGSAGSSAFVYAPQYESLFPPVSGWVLLADYNCDGKADLFTSYNNSFCVYRNDYTVSGGLSFSFVKAFPNLDFYIINSDIPAITDVDNDGDLDLLSFDPSGLNLYYFKNLSQDLYHNCDSLEFITDDHCWGSFAEDFFSCGVTLQAACVHRHDAPTPIEWPSAQGAELNSKHAAATSGHPGNNVMAIDLDGDGDKEVVVGSIVCYNAFMLTNGGTPTTANMVQLDSLYPDTIHPIYMIRFPATFNLDLDNDGKKDLVASPASVNSAEDTASVWFYKNTGTATVPHFDFQTKDLFQSDMIDVGEGSAPVFFDYDGDGLKDLLIGNYCYFAQTIPLPSGIAFYKNVGTANAPAFRLVTRDLDGLSSLGLNGLYPAFGDLDGDGDEDMLIGESEGTLIYFENTATAGQSASFVLRSNKYANIDVGQFSTPQITDVNCDGRKDLLVGERGGVIRYFENTGRPDSAVFSSTPTVAKFGNIDVMPVCCTGYAVPYLTTDSAGNSLLLVGTENNSIWAFTGIDADPYGIFTLLDTAWGGIHPGLRTTVSGSDINSDGKEDLVIGNYAGGVELFKGLSPRLYKTCLLPVDTLPFAVTVFPDPVMQDLTLSIRISGMQANDAVRMEFYNTVGQKIFAVDEAAQFNDWTYSFSVGTLAGGVYLVRISFPGRADLSTITRRFMVGN